MVNLKYLKLLRLNREKSQQNIAESLDISLQAYNKKEVGKVCFTTEELAKLASYYSVPIENFFNKADVILTFVATNKPAYKL